MKDDRAFLMHILDAIAAIQEYLAGATILGFRQSRLLQAAVVRELEIIGEAAKNLSEHTRQACSDVEWGEIIGLRNRLTHAYFQVDVDLVWEIAHTDVPALDRKIREMVSQLEAER